MRDLIRLFEEPGTRDELGIGSIRDAFSELLFPGTSVIQTRARYFLFVPWHFVATERRGLSGDALLQRVDQEERKLVERFRKVGAVNGLIGRIAGARVKTLPSTIYWNGLEQFGILTAPMSMRAASSFGAYLGDEGDELVSRRMSAWHPTLPPAPKGFPGEDSGGFDMTAEEAAWLQERVLTAVPGTLLAHLVSGPALTDSAAAWEEPSTLLAPVDVRDIVEHSRRFSSVIQGASLLYNLILAETYEARGFTSVTGKVDEYGLLLDEWAASVRNDHETLASGLDAFWAVVLDGNPRVPPTAQWFVQTWLDVVAAAGTEEVGRDGKARELIRSRVIRLRGLRSLLHNDKQLALWGGSWGSSPLVFRWRTVRQLVIDIQEGLARAGA